MPDIERAVAYLRSVLDDLHSLEDIAKMAERTDRDVAHSIRHLKRRMEENMGNATKRLVK